MLRIKLIVLGCLLPVWLYAGGVKFTFTDVAGKLHTEIDYKGKWVIVNYWATWCPPCLDEIPELIDYHETYQKKQAVVLGVNHEEFDEKELKTFISEYFISYPILRGKESGTTPFGPLIGLPTTYVLSPEGKLVATKIGGVTKKWLEEVTQVKSKTTLGSIK